MMQSPPQRIRLLKDFKVERMYPLILSLVIPTGSKGWLHSNDAETFIQMDAPYLCQLYPIYDDSIELLMQQISKTPARYEWQCECGEWINGDFGCHYHVRQSPVLVTDMISSANDISASAGYMHRVDRTTKSFVRIVK